MGVGLGVQKKNFDKKVPEPKPKPAKGACDI